MTIDEKIEKLDEFKLKLRQWEDEPVPKCRDDLRTYINQNMTWVRREVLEAGCFMPLTISPPPLVGGLVMRNVDPFIMMFDPPYDMNLLVSLST